MRKPSCGRAERRGRRAGRRARLLAAAACGEARDCDRAGCRAGSLQEAPAPGLRLRTLAGNAASTAKPGHGSSSIVLGLTFVSAIAATPVPHAGSGDGTDTRCALQISLLMTSKMNGYGKTLALRSVQVGPPRLQPSVLQVH
jgi:hypothetical protein